MPASALTVTAVLTSGSGIAFSAPAMIRNPGSEAMMPPKPYSAAVFIEARSEPPTAALVPSANRVETVRQAKTGRSGCRAPAPHHRQIAVTGPTSVTSGLVMASCTEWVAP